MVQDVLTTTPEGTELSVVPLIATELGVDFGARSVGPFDFEVDAGELVCLLGGNGSGKTTAIRLALGLIRCTTGVARVFGQPVSPTSPPQSVGYVPDRADFWNWQSATGNLRPFAVDDAAVAKALDDVGLAASADVPVRRFSRGMRQRLSIARALLAESRLLVLDEPTIALDASGIDLLIELLIARRTAGDATLVATHDAGFLARLDARIVDVEDGHTR